ncbi:ATP-binding protein [Leuconostocaceae bacterium ESL0958]|nr:ATP-binding protein [Leuconostocaceae bacterium ESL0958]
MANAREKKRTKPVVLSIQTWLTLAMLVGFLLLLAGMLAVFSLLMGPTLRQEVMVAIGHYWFYLLIAALLWTALLAYITAQTLVSPVKRIQKTMLALEAEPLTESRVDNLSFVQELRDAGLVLNQTMDQVQALIHSQQDFVSDVSHELRTPVAIVKGHLGLLNRWGKDDPAVLADSINSSLAEIKRMETLVNEMLALTRAENLSVNTEPVSTPVISVAERVYHDFQMMHPEFSWVFDNDLDGEATIGIRPNHLEQLLIILIDNAIKYSADRKEIHLALSSAGTWVELGVQDFGQGIASEDLNRVFDRFYRVDKARVHQAGGNGLGLSIVEKMVAAYGGQVRVESALGSGSVFRLRFQTVRTEQTAAIDQRE